MSSEFEKSLTRFIELNNLFENADRVLLAVSGGADSTALLYALCSLRDSNIIDADFVCAHVNHMLRGLDADKDRQFVVEQARRLSMPVITKKVNVPAFARQNKLSIETAARDLRIKTLLEIAEANGCPVIATAHQADDNAETIIHNIIRGTGLRGLAGIRPKRSFEGKIFVRPLLCFTRPQVIEYLEERKIPWCTDKTNFDCSYRRNFIRHRLVPEIQKKSSAPLVKLLSALADKAGRLCLSVESVTEQIWPAAADFEKDRLKLKLKVFSVQHPQVQIELIRKALNYIGCGQRDLTFDHYRRILALANKEPGNKKISLPGEFTARKEYENLLFFKPARKSDVEPAATGPVEIAIPGQTEFGYFKIEARITECPPIENLKAKRDASLEQFDLEKISLPIKIRRRLEGDRFQPLGLDSDKKISRFLIDAKLPPAQRQNTLVVTDREKIIWLWPIRISENVKITDKTTKVLLLKITGNY